jgi:hypothetical protein
MSPVCRVCRREHRAAPNKTHPHDEWVKTIQASIAQECGEDSRDKLALIRAVRRALRRDEHRWKEAR